MSLGRNELLQVGDLLLVTQNNLISGFMNGDMVRVEGISHARYQRAQLSFLKVGVRELATGKNSRNSSLKIFCTETPPILHKNNKKACTSIFLEG